MLPDWRITTAEAESSSQSLSGPDILSPSRSGSLVLPQTRVYGIHNATYGDEVTDRYALSGNDTSGRVYTHYVLSICTMFYTAFVPRQTSSRRLEVRSTRSRWRCTQSAASNPDAVLFLVGKRRAGHDDDDAGWLDRRRG